MHIGRRACVVAAVFVLTGCGALDSLILRPTAEPLRTPMDFNYPYETIELPLDDGVVINVWRVPTTQPTRKGTVVVVPGNDANKGRYVLALPIFVDDGWDVLLMDYEGFGLSTGQATLEGLVRSTAKVFDYAQEHDPVVVGLGISLGTPVLARVAADRPLTACIFESTIVMWQVVSLIAEKNNIGSPLANAADVVATLSTPQDYDIVYWIQRVKSPKLFLHSPDDSFTPFAGAWEVFQAAPKPKHLFATEGEHALQLFLDPVLYRKVLNGYLDGVLGNDPTLNAEFSKFLDEEFQQGFADAGFAPF